MNTTAGHHRSTWVPPAVSIFFDVPRVPPTRSWPHISYANNAEPIWFESFEAARSAAEESGVYICVCTYTYTYTCTCTYTYTYTYAYIYIHTYTYTYTYTHTYTYTYIYIYRERERFVYLCIHHQYHYSQPAFSPRGRPCLSRWPGCGFV